jgi:hypothetical protein
MESPFGPSAPEITREIYLQAIPEEQRRAVDAFAFRDKSSEVA